MSGMTLAEIKVAKALGGCSFQPGSWDKRFCRDLAHHANHMPERPLSERQGAHLLRLAYKYRRQLSGCVIESALDQMEANADRRAAEGRGALPDFTPARKAARKDRRSVFAESPLPLFPEETP